MQRPQSLSIALVATLAGCAAPVGEPTREAECSFTAGFRPGGAVGLAKQGRVASEPVVVGSWDGWLRPAPGSQHWRDVTVDGLDWRTLTSTLPPGTYQYAVLLDDILVTDELNPRTSFARDPRGLGDDPLGTEVSELEMPDCTEPALQVIEATGSQTGLTVAARYLRGARGGAAIDPGTLLAELRHGADVLAAPALALDGTADGAPRVRLRVEGLAPGKYTVRLSASALDGRAVTPVEASAFVEAHPARALGDGLLYQIVIDRFRAASGPLSPPAAPGDRAGGTLDGVRAAIEAGYFETLGVSTLWLSPVYTNPTGHFTGRDGHLYEAYHGYWPSDPRGVEPQLGGEAQLEQLIAAAHARGLRVIFDAVPNHVYQSHPYYQAHSLVAPDVAQAADLRLADWFNDGPLACVCGSPGCDWGAMMETCWFDHYLPDLDWRNPAVRGAGVDDLVWWTRRFDLDGLRIDAVPMMPRAATRGIVHAFKADVHREGLDSLVVGENYTGLGEDGRQAIRAYLGSTLDGLDSEFDFPLMWTARTTIAHGAGSLADLETDIAGGNRDWGQSGATMTRFIGNHDTTRFVSEAEGAISGDAWNQPPAQPTDEAPYRRQVMAMGLMMTLPGMPVLYYGDEVGLAGGSDPDSRRVLPDVLSPATLSPLGQQTLAQIARLGRLRACLPALRHDGRQPLFADADRLVALHTPPDGERDHALVVMSRAAAPSDVPLAGVPHGQWRDALSGAALTVDDHTPSFTALPLSFAVYLPEGSACLE